MLAATLKLFLLELTVCFETNLLKSRNYKKNRYAYLKENIIDKSEEVDLIFLELSSLGFYSMEIGHFKNFVKDLKLNLEKCADMY